MASLSLDLIQAGNYCKRDFPKEYDDHGQGLQGIVPEPPEYHCSLLDRKAYCVLAMETDRARVNGISFFTRRRAGSPPAC